MDKLFDALVPRLPTSLAIPAALVLILLLAWPNIRIIWQDIIPFYRSYSREKMRLELLKLRYEIEAIRKKNKLPDLEQHAKGLASIRVIDRAHNFILPTPIKLAAGAVGGLVISIANIVSSLSDLMDKFTNLGGSELIQLFLGFVVASVLVSLIGALAAMISKPTSMQQAFLIGAAAAALLVSSGHLLVKSAPQLHETASSYQAQSFLA